MLKPHDKNHDQAIIKRAGRKADAAAHGGAWKVAFADFCLALLSLFLVLWLMAAREQQSMKETMKDSRASKFNEGEGVMPEAKGGPRGSLIDRFPMPRDGMGDTRTQGKQAHSSGEIEPTDAAKPKVAYESPDDLTALARVLAKMSVEAGLSSNLDAVVTPYGLRVMLHDTDKQGMFVRGSAIPTDRFKRLLRQMGPLFAQMENQMLVVGHTDSSQYADTDYSAYSNWTLSSNRAMAARAQLLIGSMHAESVLQVVGMADRAPVDAKDTAAAVNRRIELLILTRGQADSVAAMFGMNGHPQAFNKDIDTALPDVSVIKQLRDKLAPAKPRGEPAERPAGTSN